jgi:DNA (cytosine-5)-methyltransferase 1
MARKYKAIGCHIYAGGFTLGVREHFDVVAHLEEWNFGVETVRKNLKIPVHVGKPSEWPITDYVGRVDLVFGNPPCAPWSQGAGREGGLWQKDPRVQYWINVLELLDRLKPTVWACESVRGIYVRGRTMTEPYVIAAAKKGYRATHVLVNALEHGVPQSRPRYFLVLSKVDLQWYPTGLKRDASMADAWRKLPKRRTEIITKSYFERFLKKADPGEDLRTTFNREMAGKMKVVNGKVTGRPAFSVKRLRSEGLAHVITGGRSFVHPREHRFLTVEEQQLLCGYPPSYVFHGAVSGQYAQIGKAVMPPVAAYMGRVFAMALKRNKKPPVLAAEEVTILRDQVVRRDMDRYEGPLFQMPAAAPPVAPLPGRAKPKGLPGKPVSRVPGVPYKGSGYRIRQMLVEGKDTETILRIIHKEFTMSKATGSDVSWNRAKLARQGGAP